MKFFIFLFVTFFASSLAAIIPGKIVEPISIPVINKEVDHIHTKRDILTVERPTVDEKEIVEEPIVKEKIIEVNRPILKNEFIVERLPLIDNLKNIQPIVLEREVIRYEEPLRDDKIRYFPRREFLQYYDEPMRSLYDRQILPMEMRFKRPTMRVMPYYNRAMYQTELDFIREPLYLDTLEPMNMYSKMFPLRPTLTKPVVELF